jgi:hypothetical protein
MDASYARSMAREATGTSTVASGGACSIQLDGRTNVMPAVSARAPSVTHLADLMLPNPPPATLGAHFSAALDCRGTATIQRSDRRETLPDNCFGYVIDRSSQRTTNAEPPHDRTISSQGGSASWTNK